MNSILDGPNPRLTNMKRRVFLTGISTVALMAAGRSWQVAFGQSALTDQQTATLLRMARDIFPHDTLSEEPYQAVVGQLRAAAGDAGTYDLLSSGLDALDEAAGRNWVDLPEAGRITVLKSIQGTPFFITVRMTALFGLYGNPAIWPAFGYEGASYKQGGYLFRGFNDLEWLPEPES